MADRLQNPPLSALSVLIMILLFGLRELASRLDLSLESLKRQLLTRSYFDVIRR